MSKKHEFIPLQPLFPICRAPFCPYIQNLIRNRCAVYEYVIERPLRWASLGGADGGRLMTPPTLRLLSSRRLDGDRHHQVLPFELPEVSPRRLGYKARFAYTSCLSGGGDKKGESLDEESSCGIADCVQKLDLHALAAGTAPLRAALARFEGKIAGSPLFVLLTPFLPYVTPHFPYMSRPIFSAGLCHAIRSSMRSSMMALI